MPFLIESFFVLPPKTHSTATSDALVISSTLLHGGNFGRTSEVTLAFSDVPEFFLMVISFTCRDFGMGSRKGLVGLRRKAFNTFVVH